MSINFETKTTASVRYPVGETNRIEEVNITNKGIEIMDGYVLLPWDWIDNGRKIIEEDNHW